MKTLLYFEECESVLSEKLLERTDINIIILRTTKNLKFFSPEYLHRTNTYNVFVADYNNDITTEAKRFLLWCKENKIFPTHFLNDSEYYLEYANEFARTIGLEALSKEQVQWVRDKVAMKDKFQKSDILTTDFQPVNNLQELIDFHMRHPGKDIIIKPRSEMNSKGVYRISDINDIYNLPYEIIPNKYMAEVFCEGHEWSIESLVQDGKVLDSYLSYLPNATIWASIENKLHAHMTCLDIPDYFQFEPKAYIQKIVDAMNLKNGTMTIEIFVMSDGTPVASELGWRLPGEMACENHSDSYGFDIWNALIDISLRNPITLKYSEEKKCVGILSLPNLEGIVSYVTPLDELLKFEGAFEGKIFAKIGQYQKKRRVGSDKSGYIRVYGKNVEEVEKRMQKIHDYFRIQVDHNHTLKLVKKNEENI